MVYHRKQAEFERALENVESTGNQGATRNIPIVNILVAAFSKSASVPGNIRGLYEQYVEQERQFKTPHDRPYDFFGEKEALANQIRGQINGIGDSELKQKTMAAFDTYHTENVNSKKEVLSQIPKDRIEHQSVDGSKYYGYIENGREVLYPSYDAVYDAKIVPHSQSKANGIAQHAPQHAEKPETHKAEHPGFFKRLFGGGDKHHEAAPEHKKDHAEHAEHAASGKKTTVHLDANTSARVIALMRSLDSKALFGGDTISARELNEGLQKHSDVAQELMKAGIQFDGKTSYDLSDTKQQVADHRQQPAQPKVVSR